MISNQQEKARLVSSIQNLEKMWMPQHTPKEIRETEKLKCKT